MLDAYWWALITMTTVNVVFALEPFGFYTKENASLIRKVENKATDVRPRLSSQVSELSFVYLYQLTQAEC